MNIQEVYPRIADDGTDVDDETRLAGGHVGEDCLEHPDDGEKVRVIRTLECFDWDVCDCAYNQEPIVSEISLNRQNPGTHWGIPPPRQQSVKV